MVSRKVEPEQWRKPNIKKRRIRNRKSRLKTCSLLSSKELKL
jgi:hypothetical protein